MNATFALIVAVISEDCHCWRSGDQSTDMRPKRARL